MGRINIWELAIIFVVAFLVIGPERMPEYAAKLRQWVREARRMAVGAREQLREQMGPEFDDIDWKAYDPRQYDPRRIVREALLEDDEPTPTPEPTASSPAPHGASSASTPAESASPAAPAAAAAPGGTVSTTPSAPRRPAQPRRFVRPQAYDPAVPTPFDPEAT